MKIKDFIQRPSNLLRISLVRKIIRWAKTTSFIGFHGISVFEILTFINNERKNDHIITRTNAIAFNFFLALFPTLIFIIALLTTIPILKFEDLLNNFSDNILPEPVKYFILDTFKGLAKIPRGGILSIGVILAIFFSSNGMLALIDGFEKSYPQTFRSRPYWKKRLIALELTFLVILLVIISAILIILSNTIMEFVFDQLALNKYLVYTINFSKLIIAFLLLYALIAFIYRYGPATRKKFSLFSPGANLATIGSILTSLGFSYFVNNFGTYNKIYGSIGAIIVLMIYIQINVFILLVGFELNTAIAVNRDLNLAKKQKESTDTQLNK